MPQNKLSRLEAVNTILRAAGEAPIGSLSTQAGVQSVIAEQTMDEVDREVQTFGWTWNRREVKFVPDAETHIPVPENIVRLVGARGSHYTIRGGNLYDMTASTNEFTGSSLTLTVVELLAWDDLPQAARHYVTIKAARRYADRVVGDDSLSRFSRQDEAEAYSVLRRDEITQGKYTIFAPGDGNFIDRGSPLSWMD